MTTKRIAFIINPVGPRLVTEMEARFPGVAEFYKPDEIAPIADRFDAVMAIDRALPEGFLPAASRLKWVHAQCHGFGFLLNDELIEHGATVTNARGVHAESVAEHAFSMLLGLTRRLAEYRQIQQEHRWQRLMTDTLVGKTMCVIGVGTIGSAIARRAKSFDMKVAGVDIRPVVCESLSSLSGPDDLDSAISTADVVAVAVPFNETTRNMFPRDRLLKMKPGSYLINIARGGIVDEQAVVDMLNSGRLKGAGFDVFETEPLPADSPMWDAPNCILLPHSASFTEFCYDRLLELVSEQIRRFLAGEPLLNVVKEGLAP